MAGRAFGPEGVAAARRDEHDWACMDWLVEDSLIGGAGMSLARMVIRAGRTTPAHRHPNCAETIHVLEGEVEQRIGERLVELEPGDTAIVPPDHAHATTNRGNGDAVLMVAYSIGTRVYEPV